MTEDWRIQASATLAQELPAAYPGGPSFPAGSKVVLTSTANTPDGITSFYTPSAVALALSIAAKACRTGSELRSRFSTLPAPGPDGIAQLHRPASTAQLYDYFEQCFIACIFAFQAIEAYSNLTIAYKLLGEMSVPRKEGGELMGREAIERLPISVKLDLILPNLTTRASPKGTVVWEHFRALEDVRDATVHLKSHHQWTASQVFGESPYAIFLTQSPRVCVEYAVEVIDYFADEHERRWLTGALERLSDQPLPAV